MEILILGGTRFIGPHIVEALRSRAHEVALFNRGETNPERFPELEGLRGDRDAGDYDALRGRSWDAVVDTSAYYPRAVREALQALEGAFDHYVFVSTLSVYRDFDAETIDEDYPVADPGAELDDPATEEVDGETYGPLKVLCERAAREALGDGGRLTILRPGVVAGPEDPTDRFTYWPVRVAEGGRVLAPGDPANGVQYTDARDLADWVAQVLKQEIAGTFNTVLPAGRLTWREFLATCADVAGVDVDLEWIAADDLEEAGIAAWRDLPLWAPAGSSLRGLTGVSVERAREAGMSFREPDATVRDTLDWYRRERGGGREELRAGLDRDREEEVLRTVDHE